MASHRYECGGDQGLEDQCIDCECWCHRRCGAVMALTGERCHRLAGHGWDHRSRLVLEKWAAIGRARRRELVA